MAKRPRSQPQTKRQAKGPGLYLLLLPLLAGVGTLVYYLLRPPPASVGKVVTPDSGITEPPAKAGPSESGR